MDHSHRRDTGCGGRWTTHAMHTEVEDAAPSLHWIQMHGKVSKAWALFLLCPTSSALTNSPRRGVSSIYITTGLIERGYIEWK